ncbi:MAG: bifunctional UDP-N-acetylglucosamine diphosphorylase/glucosamine-1-phosphate N-acetyltransferase GlmU [Pseudomonadota bacterium]
MTTTSAPLSVVILAAGRGTRMKSRLPKVLQTLAGRPLLGHVLELGATLSAEQTVIVYGHGGDAVKAAFDDPALRWAEQAEQLGTGHAVLQAMDQIDPSHRVLILCGDVPLLTLETVRRLLDETPNDAVGVLTVRTPKPHGYGRIVRNDNNHVVAIVEQKDASEAQQAIDEINSGVFVVPAALLDQWLRAIEPKNAQGEYYLTDIVGLAANDDVAVHGVVGDDIEEITGINDRIQLAEAECIFQRRAVNALMREGVQVADPYRVDIRGKVTVGQDVFLDVNTVLIGDVTLGDGAKIGPNCVVIDSTIGAETELFPNCVVEQSTIGAHSLIGPFARLRPLNELADRTKVGNFVELKKSVIAEGSKVNHLTYVGDSLVGKNVNIGAGTITCNYDGANKHQTIIGDGAFIGSGVELVAPVEIGTGATIGAGSTISKSAPDHQLTLERARQRSIEGWERPVKKPK